ncbi:MAG: 16S rRNA (guanine(966)-N(2))-methyltransferase RsmD [Chlamydiae bacterium]|nr:16S rRNA (guanine(966)-N(2))-methyltransferase RsmD [Chlamydiota bacterium]
MSLRIIGGRFKNHPIQSPPGLLTKPTMSMMRKSVFDICQAYVEGANFLDVFACSGAMGIEALSRGACSATFIDLNKKACSCIQNNLKKLNILSEATILCKDAMSSLEKLAEDHKHFTIAYVDPPYTLIQKEGYSPREFLAFFDSSDLLENHGMLFIEERFPATFQLESLSLKTLTFKNSRKFSSSLLHLFVK